MAGIRLPIIPKRVFDFSNMGVGVQDIVVAERIDISQYIECMVALRVHASVMAPGSSLAFNVFGDGYTRNDPTLTFRTATPLFPTSSLPILNVDPQNLTTYGGTVRGRYAQIVATASKPSGGTFTATVSLDMILRSPDDS